MPAARDTSGDDDPPEADLDDPATLLGLTLLVGITYLDASGGVARQIQRFGTIVDIGVAQGDHVVIRREGHPDFSVPYDPGAMRWAEAATYRLRETGEAIENPDILATWTVSPSQS